MEISAAELVLIRVDGRLTVCQGEAAKGRGLAIDFTTIDIRRHTLSRRQPLARAFRGCDTIIDATAGLGHDAFLLACLGFTVTAIERSPVLFALLADALERALADQATAGAIGQRLRFIEGDSREVIPGDRLTADAILLDPMYPRRRNSSALAKKSIRIVRALVGDDDDAPELFRVCRPAAAKRLVVKRPKHAPPVEPDPNIVQRGKLARYDVYLTATRARQ